MMKIAIECWALGVLGVCVLVVLALNIKDFFYLPRKEQIKKVKEWLLYAVTIAEKELGAGTGALKLRYVYDLFISKFPYIAPYVSFETFSKWVDEVLEQMKHLLKTNNNIFYYVEGGEE